MPNDLSSCASRAVSRARSAANSGRSTITPAASPPSVAILASARGVSIGAKTDLATMTATLLSTYALCAAFSSTAGADANSWVKYVTIFGSADSANARRTARLTLPRSCSPSAGKRSHMKASTLWLAKLGVSSGTGAPACSHSCHGAPHPASALCLLRTTCSSAGETYSKCRAAHASTRPSITAHGDSSASLSVGSDNKLCRSSSVASAAERSANSANVSMRRVPAGAGARMDTR
mmetsp:Transcript_33839/g.87789  ORF Transcript_33839/g.87789 Transcript_33839/m.87789 type:complete len:235 (-) Transcript_33839:141-845(-)